MSAQVDVYNIALQAVGAKRVATISDSTKGALAITAIWDEAVASQLSMFAWNFALKQAELVATTDPTFGYECAYTLPADCLKVLKMSNASYKYRIFGATLETDLDSSLGDGYEVEIEYIKSVTDVTLWPSLFVNVVGLYLAKEICISMTGHANRAQMLEQRYQVAVAMAQANDWQQDNELYPGQTEPSTGWLTDL